MKKVWVGLATTYLALVASPLLGFNEKYYDRHGDHDRYAAYHRNCCNRVDEEVCCAPPVCARGEYYLMGDWHLTMPVGAEDVITAHRFLLKFDDLCWEPSFLHDCGWWGRLARFARVVLLDDPVADLAMVIQHEVFGHGARLREQGMDSGYHIDAPFPYGDGGGATFYDGVVFGGLTAQEKMALNTGGVESTGVLAESLAYRILCTGQLDFRQAILYTSCLHDLTRYVLSISEIDADDDGHDIASYINFFNIFCPDDQISRGFLKARIWINLLDPLTWYSYWSIGNYIWNDKNCCEVPMLGLCGVRFFPSMRYHLAPFGPEYGLHSFFAYDGLLASGYVRYGDICDRSTFAMGVDCPRFWCWCRWVFGGRADIWYQPNPANYSDFGKDRHLGGMVIARATRELGCSYGAIAEVGVKSRGWVPGEPVSSYIFFRLGMMLLDF